MVLSRFLSVEKRKLTDGWDYVPRNHLTRVCTPESVAEANLLIQLFLDNGASPRRPAGRVLYHGRECDGPLEAAIATGVPSLVKLIFQHGPADPSHPENAGFTKIIRQALSLDRAPYDLGRHRLNPLGDRLLATLQAVGFPVTEIIVGLSLLPTAVYEAVKRNKYKIETDGSLLTMIRAGVNVDDNGPGQLCPLSQVVAASTFRTDDHLADDENISEDEAGDSLDAAERQYICTLLNKGANIDNPAFGPQGFTPLFIATAEHVPCHVFRTLIRAGGDRTGQRQLFPGEPSFTLLQCLFMGMPAPTRTHDINWPERLIQVDLRDKEYMSIRAKKKVKFNVWLRKELEHGLRSPFSSFYVDDNKHILTWAIERLDGLQLMDAISILYPLYYRTRRDEDEQHPLLTMFREQERQGYLSIGTLGQTFAVLKSIVSNMRADDGQAQEKAGHPEYPPLGYTNQDGETVIHLVCQLHVHVPTVKTFNLIRGTCGRAFDFDSEFWRDGRRGNPDVMFGSATPEGNPAGLSVSHSTIKEVATKYYIQDRRQNIAKIINYLLAHSPKSALWARDKNGISAYMHAKNHGHRQM
ncbi:unnamed protein product [Clonostachys rosea]|uniref:Uncharacterized protein n=1 Tax=Bionectria ochroleuca TaxID=29856 RepID=A0ABY6UB91_BIOOC|nr:unnamed protein product [Clonostachys rosea]